MYKNFLFLIIFFGCVGLHAQTVTCSVYNAETKEIIRDVTVRNDSNWSATSNEKGIFQAPSYSKFIYRSAIGFESKKVEGPLYESMMIYLNPAQQELDEVVVTGTMKAVSRLESPIAVEVYAAPFFRKNPAPSVFESLQNVNGVRPQLNCSVCNTGDIHINGLEGPYTMVTIDGMPIVSSLASVYGLFGIPTQLIDRVEIVKGPASGLYGSEAIGGLINIITRSPEKAAPFSINVMSTSWLENNIDLGLRLKAGKKITGLIGLNYFNYDKPVDKNHDGFTDVTLQERISIFNKWRFTRRSNRVASLAGRIFFESRWGGEMRWNESFKGGDSIYGEAIDTRRWEMIGQYQLPVMEKLVFSFSATEHRQDSWYGKTPYAGRQKIIFTQLTWDKMIGEKHSVLAGLTGRYQQYDDNSTATIDTLTGKNSPEKAFIPGVFVQDQWKYKNNQELLTGIRLDHHPVHGMIFTPRIALKVNFGKQQVIRLNAGTGFRVVSVFTEDHAALTGSRVVEIVNKLLPERSYNASINYSKKWKWKKTILDIELSGWYSYFENQIIANYDTDPRKIIYDNLWGHARSNGITLNTEWTFAQRLKIIAGTTLQEVTRVDVGADNKLIKTRPVLTEKWSGTWSVSYSVPGSGLNFDYTGNLYGPMRLPLVSALDPRPAYSSTWSIQNIQCSKKLGKKLEIFGGVKNILNWTPARHTDFIIARTNDPFNKKVEYNTTGQVVSTPENPYALVFDPAYVYAPNQGAKFFIGLRL